MKGGMNQVYETEGLLFTQSSFVSFVICILTEIKQDNTAVLHLGQYIMIVTNP